MKWQILVCFLVVCLVASQARPKRKTKDKDKADGSNPPVKQRGWRWRGQGNNKPLDNIDAAIKAAGRSLVANEQQQGSSFGSNLWGNLFGKKWNKSPSRWGNKKGKKGKGKGKGGSRSKSRSRKRCKNNFSFFSFLKLFGLPQAFVGNDDPEDRAVCEEVSQCILLSYGRLTLQDCQDRLVAAGLETIPDSIIAGSPLEDQISAVTNDLRACMDRLDGQQTTTATSWEMR